MSQKDPQPKGRQILMDSNFVAKSVTARYGAAPDVCSLPFIHNLLSRAMCQFLEVPLIYESQKMKKLLVGVLFLMLVSSVFSATKKTGWEEDGLKGKVKEKITVDYEVKKNKLGEVRKNKSGEDVKKVTRKYIPKYDDNGNKIEEAWHVAKENFIGSADCKANGDFIEKEIYKYDNKGNMIESTSCTAKGDLVIKYTSKYDDKGNKIEETWYKEKGVVSKATSKYDDKGNQIEKAFYTPQSELIIKSIPTKYDDKGNKIEEATYNDKGTLEKITTTTYTYY